MELIKRTNEKEIPSHKIISLERSGNSFATAKRAGIIKGIIGSRQVHYAISQDTFLLQLQIKDLLLGFLKKNIKIEVEAEVQDYSAFAIGYAEHEKSGHQEPLEKYQKELEQYIKESLSAYDNLDQKTIEQTISQFTTPTKLLSIIKTKSVSFSNGDNHKHEFLLTEGNYIKSISESVSLEEYVRLQNKQGNSFLVTAEITLLSGKKEFDQEEVSSFKHSIIKRLRQYPPPEVTQSWLKQVILNETSKEQERCQAKVADMDLIDIRPVLADAHTLELESLEITDAKGYRYQINKCNVQYLCVKDLNRSLKGLYQTLIKNKFDKLDSGKMGIAEIRTEVESIIRSYSLTSRKAKLIGIMVYNIKKVNPLKTFSIHKEFVMSNLNRYNMELTFPGYQLIGDYSFDEETFRLELMEHLKSCHLGHKDLQFSKDTILQWLVHFPRYVEWGIDPAFSKITMSLSKKEPRYLSIDDMDLKLNLDEATMYQLKLDLPGYVLQEEKFNVAQQQKFKENLISHFEACINKHIEENKISKTENNENTISREMCVTWLKEFPRYDLFTFKPVFASAFLHVERKDKPYISLAELLGKEGEQAPMIECSVANAQGRKYTVLFDVSGHKTDTANFNAESLRNHLVRYLEEKVKILSKELEQEECNNLLSSFQNYSNLGFYLQTPKCALKKYSREKMIKIPQTEEDGAEIEGIKIKSQNGNYLFSGSINIKFFDESIQDENIKKILCDHVTHSLDMSAQIQTSFILESAVAELNKVYPSRLEITSKNLNLLEYNAYLEKVAQEEIQRKEIEISQKVTEARMENMGEADIAITEKFKEHAIARAEKILTSYTQIENQMEQIDTQIFNINMQLADTTTDVDDEEVEEQGKAADVKIKRLEKLKGTLEQNKVKKFKELVHLEQSTPVGELKQLVKLHLPDYAERSQRFLENTDEKKKELPHKTED